MKTRIMSVFASMIFAGVLIAGDVPENMNFRGDVNFDKSCNIKINGTKVTATAAEINQLAETVLSVETMKIERVESTTGGFSGMPLAASPNQSYFLLEDFYHYMTDTNIPAVRVNAWKYAGDSTDKTGTTIAIGAGGILKYIPTGTANDEQYIQYTPLATEGAFGIASNSEKRMWFEARIAGPHTNAPSSTFIGLATNGSSAADFMVDDSGRMTTNGAFMGFWCNSLNSSNRYWNFIAHKPLATYAATPITTNGVLNTSLGTYKRLGFAYDGVRTLTAYGDGTSIGSFTVNNAEYPLNVQMMPVMAVKTLATFVPTNYIDFIYVNEER